MSPGNGKGRPRQGDPIPSNVQNLDNEQGTPTRRRNAGTSPLNVFAHGYLVVGTRGRCRLVLVVASCPYCHRPHAHNGRPDFATGKRQASCHEGRYIVHVGTIAGEEAA